MSEEPGQDGPMTAVRDPQHLVDATTAQRMEHLAREASEIAGCAAPTVAFQDARSYCPVSAVYGRGRNLKITIDPMVAGWSDDEVRAIFAQRLCGRDVKGAHGLPVAGTAALMCAFLALPMGIVGPLSLLASGGAKLVPWLACETALIAPSLLVQARRLAAWRKADARYIQAGGAARPLISALRKSQRGDRDVTRTGAIAEFCVGFFFSGLSPECAIRRRLNALRPSVRSDFARQRSSASGASRAVPGTEDEDVRRATLHMAREGSWGYPSIAKARRQLTIE